MPLNDDDESFSREVQATMKKTICHLLILLTFKIQIKIIIQLAQSEKILSKLFNYVVLIFCYKPNELK
jgi:hypothetical protein